MSPENSIPPARGGPESISDIRSTTTAAFRGRLGRALWGVVAAGVLWDVGAFIVLFRWGITEPRAHIAVLALPWIILGVWRGNIAEAVRGQFWRQFAKRRGYTYTARGDPRGEQAVMFQQGHNRVVRHVVSGKLRDGRPIRIFEYEFRIGHGKSRRTYCYTVFEVCFSGRFPHIYLNNLRNRYDIRIGSAVPLPHEFEKAYRLSAPEKYEIEALQIFTPDLLAYVLDAKLPHDLELVDQELLVFAGGYVNRLDELEKEAATALALAERLASKLDRFAFTAVGTHPTTLT